MNLTERQREIAELLLITGSDRATVCSRLGMTDVTLRAHLREMRQRLGADTDAAMMARLRELNRDPVPMMLERCRAEPRRWWTC
jgi:DNA-binding NarL/FixJ family response regulator